MSIAKVEPLTTARALRGPFDYRLPEEMSEVGVGSVVRVPFGRRQPVLGVVVEMAESSELPPERLVEPLEALETGVPVELVRLGLWVAREYCSTPARGLRLVLPPGRRGPQTPRQAAARAARGRRLGGGRALAPARAGPRGRADRRGPRRRGRGGSRAARARGHRLGQDRGLPRRRRGGARPGQRGDRPRPRDRPRPAGGGTISRPARRPLRRPALRPHRTASATTSGGGCATARRASASARARRSSPRSRTSAWS